MRWRQLLGVAALLAMAAATGVLLVAWLGLYNIAASSGHWAIVDRFLRFAMANSVKARAPDITPPPLDDPALIRLGAGHFHSGCAFCHGAPDAPVSPAAGGMLPPPPTLASRLDRWRDQELFWIVRHGIKYTGMPAWPVLQRQDEVWALVAFLRRLPTLDAASYRELALGEVEIEPQEGPAVASARTSSDAVDACARCHGAEHAPRSDLVPTLHGQPAPMLLAALRAYATRKRQSGVMQMAASGLSDSTMRNLAEYYASLPAPARSPEGGADPARIERGRRLALEGDAAAEIPACTTCHEAGSLPVYPRLAGQPARYLEGQLRAWQAGLNDITASAIIMAPIARRLGAEQVKDVSAYFGSLPPSPPTDGPGQ
jgi:cytochrome c553